MTNDEKQGGKGQGLKAFDLHVRTHGFAVEDIRFYVRQAKNEVTRVLDNQLMRAATSIGANDAEADHARSKAEFVAKIGDCLKEAGETKYWLLLFRKTGYQDPRLDDLLDEAGQLEKIFYKIKKP